MEYVKIDLDRWQQINDENRELNERFDGLKKGGIVIVKRNGFLNYTIAILYDPIDEVIKEEIEKANRELEYNNTAYESRQLEKLKQMNYFEFRKWKRENK